MIAALSLVQSVMFFGTTTLRHPASIIVAHLIQMGDSEFDDLAKKVVLRTVRLEDPNLTAPDSINWIFNGYCERLIDNNEELQAILREFPGRFEDPECDITKGQRIEWHCPAFLSIPAQHQEAHGSECSLFDRFAETCQSVSAQHEIVPEAISTERIKSFKSNRLQGFVSIWPIR